MSTFTRIRRAVLAMTLAALPCAAAPAGAGTFDGIDPKVIAIYQRVLTANEIDQRCRVFDAAERGSLTRLLADLNSRVFDAAATSAQIQSRRSVVLMLQAILRARIEQEYAAGGCDMVLQGMTALEPELTHGNVVHEVRGLFYN